MYDWKNLNVTERKEIQLYRKKAKIPWHSPPHYDVSHNTYLLTAANYQHQVVIGTTLDRMASFEKSLLEVMNKHAKIIYAWSVLPNHYHALVETEDLAYTIYGLGQMHGRTSRAWNLEDKTPGRKCWYRCLDRAIWTEKQLYTAVNYVHYNLIKHGYVDKMHEWTFTSAEDFLNNHGRDRAIQLWKDYPIDEFIKGGD